MITKSSLPEEPSFAIKNGEKLVGEDLSNAELKVWFEQEESAFYTASKGTTEADPWYAYMRYVNVRLGIKKVSSMCPSSAHLVSLGPGDGSELPDILREIDIEKITLVEASKHFQSELKSKYPSADIISPSYTGSLDVNNESVDVLIAFGVLHHIPNPSRVIAEFSRVLKPGGFLITREPCSSMGLWSVDRVATPNERGIPSSLMLKYASDNDLKVIGKPIPIMFEPINKILKRTVGFKFAPFHFLYPLDRFISWLVSFNDHYWRDTLFKKIGPSSYFYVFHKL